jgi:hypothetical protein
MIICASDQKPWVGSQPLGQLIITRLILEPLRELMETKLYVASLPWELRQNAAAAAQQMNPDGSSWPNRKYALGEASKNAAEDTCIAKLGALLDPSLWVCMPNDSLTEACQATCFMVMSCVGCLVEELLRQRHRLAPWITLAILWDIDAASQILSMPRCLFDQLSRELIDEGNFGDLESRMKVFALVLAGRCDISNLESLHAWVRKQIMKRVQTHGLCIEDLGALWVFGRNRSSLPRAQGEPATRTRKAAPPEGEPEPKQQKKCRSNSWNLFCRRYIASLFDPGQRKDWTAISEEYQKLSPREKLELKQETKEAKVKANAFGLRGSVFGETASRQAAKAFKAAGLAADDAAQGGIQSYRGEPDLPQSISVTEQPESISLEALHNHAMKLERKGGGKKQAEERRAEAIIGTWLRTQCSMKAGLILSKSEAVPGSPGKS